MHCKWNDPPCLLKPPSTGTTKPPTVFRPPVTAPTGTSTCEKGTLGWNKSTGKAALFPNKCGKFGYASCKDYSPGTLCCI